MDTYDENIKVIIEHPTVHFVFDLDVLSSIQPS